MSVSRYVIGAVSAVFLLSSSLPSKAICENNSIRPVSVSLPFSFYQVDGVLGPARRIGGGEGGGGGAAGGRVHRVERARSPQVVRVSLLSREVEYLAYQIEAVI